jgi:hypothetical protein
MPTKAEVEAIDTRITKTLNKQLIDKKISGKQQAKRFRIGRRRTIRSLIGI